MNIWEHIFAFDSRHPLLFTQNYFWIFFALVYIGYACLMEIGRKREGRESTPLRLHLRNIYLMLVSWFFYYKTSGAFLLILLFVTMSDWSFAWLIHRAHQKGRQAMKNLWLTMSVLIDLGILAYFKYAYFGVDVFNTLFSTHVTITEKIILPVGISFYTFQIISYTTDDYRGLIAPVKSPLDFGFFVSFFPQLVAGPIVRAKEFIPQLYKPFFLSRRQFGIAVFWIVNGLLKKIILSDYLAVNFIDRVFENPLLFSGFENVFAVFAYSLQVYADFSGYTDIAIGLALLMGFYLPKNFDSPYKSRNPQEFWRRWHMSLSRWLKSYVYIPLGGNRTLFGRKSSKLLASNVNSFATMLIGGLWHGASWNFVIWGGLNGLGMIFVKCWHALKVKILGTLPQRMAVTLPHLPKAVCRIDNVISILLTFTFITFTRLFFRSGSNLDPASANQQAWETAKNMMGQIFGAWNNQIILPFLWEYRKVFMLFVIGMTIHWFPAKFKQWYRLAFAALPVWVMALLVVMAVIAVYQFVSADMQPFIYFQF